MAAQAFPEAQGASSLTIDLGEETEPRRSFTQVIEICRREEVVLALVNSP